MEKTLNKKSYDTITKGVHWFIQAFIVFFYVIIGLLLIATIAFLLIPKGSLDFDLANIQNIRINIMNVIYDINRSIFTGIINVKWPLIFVFFIGIVNLAFIQYILIQLKKVIKNVKDKKPFSTANIAYLKYMGYAFLIAGVILPTLNRALLQVILNQLNIHDTYFNISLNFQLLFMGAIILVLTYVFDYGAYLQEEHDSTV